MTTTTPIPKCSFIVNGVQYYDPQDPFALNPLGASATQFGKKVGTNFQYLAIAVVLVSVICCLCSVTAGLYSKNGMNTTVIILIVVIVLLIIGQSIFVIYEERKQISQISSVPLSSTSTTQCTINPNALQLS